MFYDAKRRKSVTTGLNSAKNVPFHRNNIDFHHPTFSKNMTKPNRIQFLQILIRKRH